MSKYVLDNGKVVDSLMATESWQEAERWDGRNHISKATGSEWEHETLYRSSKGNYWVEHTSQFQGSLPYAFFLSHEDAVRWLLNNEHYLPRDLLNLASDIIE